MYRTYTRLKQFFTPPDFPADVNRTRIARALYTVTNIALLAISLNSLLLVIAPSFGSVDPSSLTRGLLLIPFAGALIFYLFLARRGLVRLAAHLFIFLDWALILGVVIATGGILSINLGAFTLLLLAAGLLLDWRGLLAYLGLTILACIGLLWAALAGYLPGRSTAVTELNVFIVQTIFFSAGVGLLYLAINNIQHALDQAASELIERQRSQQILQRREAQQQAITFAAEQFLRTQDWRSNIDKVLARLGQEFNASHAYMFEHYLAKDGREFTVLKYEWTAPGYETQLGLPDYDYPLKETTDFKRYFQLLRQRKPFTYTATTAPVQERAFFDTVGILAMMEMPIFVGGRWWGTFGFDDFSTAREWSSIEVEGLMIAADIVSAAIERQVIEAEVHRLNAELEQRVEERTAQLAAANNELQSFSYMVSHDLRAPLRAIRGYSQIILMDHAPLLPEDGQVAFSNVIKATDRMSGLIDSLLQFARLSQAEMRKIEVDLSALVLLILDEMRANEPERAVRVNVTPNLVAQADTQLIVQMMHNLLDNAWKYTSHNPHAEITFGALQQNEQTVYYLRDNGIGFEMQYALRIFSPFQRLHTEDEFPGHGIGLATVQRIIQRHGGKIWAESSPAHGSTFYFTLKP